MELCGVEDGDGGALLGGGGDELSGGHYRGREF
jgi:hypothetical protein